MNGGLTEYKLNGVVKSRIVSSADPLQAGRISGSKLNITSIACYLIGFQYIITPEEEMGYLQGLTLEILTMDSLCYKSNQKFPNGQMNAYDHSHLGDAKAFIKNNRK